MEYSRKVKRISIAKRILISWMIVAIIFFAVGFGVAVMVLA